MASTEDQIVQAQATTRIREIQLTPLRHLGTGCEGDAWLCRDTKGARRATRTQPSKLLVVRLCTDREVPDEQVSEGYLREHKILTKLRHPAILDSFGLSHDHLMFMPPYVPGGTLKQFMNELDGFEVSPPPMFVWHTFQTLLDVLVHAHGQKDSSGEPEPIAHGDMHMGNMMVSCNETANNGLPRLLLLDGGFGGEFVVDSDQALEQDIAYLRSILHSLAHPRCWQGLKIGELCPLDRAKFNNDDSISSEFQTRRFSNLMDHLSANSAGDLTPWTIASTLQKRWGPYVQSRIDHFASVAAPSGAFNRILRFWSDERYSIEAKGPGRKVTAGNGEKIKLR